MTNVLDEQRNRKRLLTARWWSAEDHRYIHLSTVLLLGHEESEAKSCP